MSDEEEEILFETAEEDIADFADLEEEETIVEQEEATIEDHEEETVEDSHPSEIEDIIEEVNRVELRVESTLILKPSAIESDSDSDSYSDSYSDSSFGTSSSESSESTDSYDYFSDSDSDTEYNSDYSSDSMKSTDLQTSLSLKWGGEKDTYDEFIHRYKDWLLYTDKDQFYSFEIHPDLHPAGYKSYKALKVKSKTQRREQ